ncbi:retropepsin-like aspartic protease [uncultured Duncaniella sp.]|uniref:retropepsin-like aspartic protease n=1 Tax=uncultured Duncaniella sp. TaxID=2768039 RepID=UPI0025EE38F3|nr:retropepsin-like aspartic protease [uncultured Duncaniella sp.]
MKKYVIICIMFVAGLKFSAQTIDEKIGKAMNESDWFALDSMYRTTPKDSIDPFLEVFSRCLLGNRLNRTDISIPAFQELLSTYSLDISNLASSIYMYGMDLSREGRNAEAASMINDIVSQTRQYLDSVTINRLTTTANRYSALSAYKPYQIEFPDGKEAIIPFTIVPVGPTEKGSVLMHLTQSYINGEEADITFDTGAGSNMISIEMAKRLNLIPLDSATITVIGVDRREGYIAIAKELKIGNIIVRDVPFTVISLSSDNKEADQYIECFNIVVGSELMLHLKDLTIDFFKRHITVPTAAPKRTDRPSNLCFSPTMNLLTKGTVLNTDLLMCIDSGDASYGSLNNDFYSANADYIKSHATLDSIREAGIAGVIVTECYKVPGMPVCIGGHMVFPPELTVKLGTDVMIGDYECNIGIKTLMLYQKVRFNLVDFVLTTKSAINSSLVFPTKYNIPDFKFSKEKSLNLWQAIGIIGVGVARGMINPNAPMNPDL